MNVLAVKGDKRVAYSKETWDRNEETLTKLGWRLGTDEEYRDFLGLSDEEEE